MILTLFAKHLNSNPPPRIYIKKVIKFVQFQADLSLPKKKLDAEMEVIFKQLKVKLDQGIDVHKYGEER